MDRNFNNQLRKKLKDKLTNRQKTLFVGWISFSHPSITEIFSNINFDFNVIDMEHSTISISEAQRIIAASQSFGVPCIPRIVSHSVEQIKPLLDSGPDGMMFPTVSSVKEVDFLYKSFKYPPIGQRTFGVNRAQNYGISINNYFSNWNETSTFMIQIENKEGVENLEKILSHQTIDAVMIGPYDLSGSLGVPGQLDSEIVINNCKKVSDICKKNNVSCGIQINDVNSENIKKNIDLGFNFIVLGSDLFALWKWAEQVENTIASLK